MTSKNELAKQARFHAKQKARLLKLLAARKQKGFSYSNTNGKVAVARGDRVHHFKEGLIADLCKEKLVVEIKGVLKVTPTGLEWLKHYLQRDADQAQPSATCSDKKDSARTTANVPMVNAAESPLARLQARKGTDGRKFLSEYQFEAGERLRRDFECGQLQVRISSNWSALGAGGGKQNGAGSIVELSDFAMDARARVNAAIAALAPELAGVTLDICCFLKGFERVERERQWPPRSAKLMLRTALSILSRHYGLETGRASNHQQILGWGKEDYRPAMHSSAS